jgi:hypothetical protein
MPNETTHWTDLQFGLFVAALVAVYLFDLGLILAAHYGVVTHGK